MRKTFALLTFILAVTLRAEDMAKPTAIPLQFGGQDSAGEAMSIPDGRMRLLQDSLLRPHRLAKRPPTVYDGLMSINGLANREDITNKVSRLLALNTSHALFQKGTSGETWSTSLGTLAGSRVSSFANYRGVTYLMLDDGNGLPSVSASFDGTNLSTSPFNSALVARSIVNLDERMYLIFPRLTIFNLMYQGGVDRAYGSPQGATSVTDQKVTQLPAGSITYKLTPTSTVANTCFAQMESLAYETAVDQPTVYRSNLRNSNPGTSVPITLQAVVGGGIGRLRAYPLGALAANLGAGGFVDGTTPLMKCTTAGTTAAGAPVFNTAPNSTTADGTVVWTVIRMTSVIGQLQFMLDGVNDGSVKTFDLSAVIPGNTGTSADNTALNTVWRILFYNDNQPALTTANLVSIDVGFRDTLADSDPKKANFGQQLTLGDFSYPFFNNESSSTRVLDLASIIMSDVGLPKQIRGESFYNLTVVPGDPTAGATISKRLIASKRKAFWIFQETGFDDIVLRLERMINGKGILGPLAHDEFNDEMFFISEDDCYRFKVADQQPIPFTGDGMREEIMARGSGWVESQSTYKRPILCIDKLKLLVYVYTQKGKLYVFDLRSEQWSVWTLPNGVEIDAMLWNQNTGNVYVAFGGYGLTRIDFTVTANDTIDNTANTYPISDIKVFRPIELPTLPRADLKFKILHLFYSAPSDQSGQTLKAEWSMDQGATYPRYVEGTLNQTAAGEYRPLDITIPDWTGAQLTVRLTHTGKGGENSFMLAPHGYVDADIESHEYAKVRNLTPTTVVTS